MKTPAIPPELAAALDRLVEALTDAVAGGHPAHAVSAPVRDCATTARASAVSPESMIAALKPRLQAALARARPEQSDAYLRTLVSLAIESYFTTDPNDSLEEGR